MANEGQSRSARRKQLKTSKKGKPKSKVKKVILTIFIIGILLTIGVSGLFAYWISTAPELDESQLSAPFSSKVYGMNDELVADLSGKERRTKVTYDELPQVLVDAVIATEDSRFFSHIGIDFRRIVAAIWANITEGFGAEGASTITQQVVKRSFLSPKKTLERKVQEQYLAIKLDQEYSKEEILEMYLNKIYYGAGAYGVAEAAETYFGKTDLSKLTLPEAALLAGLPQRPSGYMPFENPERAKQRMEVVLSLMVQHGKITQEEADKASKVSIDELLVDNPDFEEDLKFAAFINVVKEEVKEILGDDVEIYKDGLKIYTTLDPEAQQTVQTMLSKEGPVAWPNEDLRTGIAVVDTQSGAIRAIGGGRDYVAGNYNYAVDIQRQPGSTFKPITAYGPAIEYEKMSTYHQIKDEPITIGEWSPNNFDDRFRGWVSARYALSRSLNIPAIKTLQEVGLKRAKEFATGLGIEFADDKIQLGDAIGGTDTVVNPLEMAGAYAAFGNEGVFTEPYTIRKIVVPGEGTVKPEHKPHTAMSKYTAFMISDMLQTTMEEGSGSPANIPGLPEAGKTGTTNRPTSEGDIAPDSWFNGYTTNYTISIWTGYEDINRGLSSAEKDIPKQIFNPLMSQLSEGIETSDFTKPDSVVWVDVEEGSRPAKLPSDYTPESQIVTELFHVDNQPTKVSQEYQKLEPVQSLEGTFNKDDNSIDLSWSYGEESNVAFRVDLSVNGGQLTELTTTSETGLNISNVQPGTVYEFIVTAITTDGKADDSEPAAVQVKVPGNEKEKPDEKENQDKEKEGNSEDDQTNPDENGNGNNNGNNGEGNNNGDDTNEGDSNDQNEDGSTGESGGNSEGDETENNDTNNDESGTDGSGADGSGNTNDGTDENNNTDAEQAA